MLRKIKTANATIVSKNKTNIGMSSTGTGVQSGPCFFGYLTVRFDSGKVRVLDVPFALKEEFGTLSEGQVGLLTFNGYDFLKFEKSE